MCQFDNSKFCNLGTKLTLFYHKFIHATILFNMNTNILNLKHLTVDNKVQLMKIFDYLFYFLCPYLRFTLQILDMVL